jgi:5-methylcytosine-specific restriction enzyme A
MPKRPASLGAGRRRERVPDRREHAAARGYGARWQAYRRDFLARDPLCKRCEQAGRLTWATVVDHVVAVQGAGDALFWRADNHQALCRRCHAVKTRADMAAGKTRGAGTRD